MSVAGTTVQYLHSIMVIRPCSKRVQGPDEEFAALVMLHRGQLI